MKNYLGALACALGVLALSVSAQAGIVNNSGTTAEDSIGIEFQLLDTLGNPVRVVSGDSAWLFVWYPGGELAFTDSVRLTSDGKISERKLDAGSHAMAFYTYQNSIAAIDGGGIEGVYKWTLMAYDSNLALASTYNGEFQLYATADYGTWADRLDEAISTRTAIGDTNKFEVTDYHLAAASIFDFTADEVTADMVKISGVTTAADRGAVHAAGDVVAGGESGIESKDYVGVGAGLQPQDGAAVHVQLQGRAVGRAQEVGAGRGAAVAAQLPEGAGAQPVQRVGAVGGVGGQGVEGVGHRRERQP
ncbi:MAG: hypothetical protein IIA44_13525, partial [Acidobacteria bacterium]|nr:hypothetical protein [Acidobacteriota bacterium]